MSEQQPSMYQQMVDKVSALNILSKELGVMMKAFSKELNKAGKKSGKRAPKTPSTEPRPLSGFAKPTKLTDELCVFLKISKDSLLARTEVTRRLNAYFREHNLQNPANKKEILPDAAIKKLLNLKAEDTLTYFNLQRHMKHLFVPTVPVAKTVVA